MSRRSRGGISAADVTQMLTEGGYYRASIRNLTEFDRVAGGLSWGILNSRHSIDVEFVENASIRDKIRIAENICRALRRDMKCPHPLEPHQIQGLDYPKLAFVLEWLLRRVSAAREENAYFVKEYTRLDFYRRFGTCVETIAAAHGNVAGSAAESVAMAPTRYRPVKSYALGLASRCPAPTRVRILSHDPPQDADGESGGPVNRTATASLYTSAMEHAAAILLEYGLQYQMRDSLLTLQAAEGEEALEEDREAAHDIARMKEEENREALMFEKLAQRMSQHKERVGGKMSTAHVHAVMKSAESEKLRKLREVYQHRQQEIQAKLAAEETACNELENARRRVENLEQEADQLHGSCADAEQKLAETQARIEEKRHKLQRRIDKADGHIRNVEEIQRIIRSDPDRSAAFDALLLLLDEKRALEKKILNEQTEGKRRVSDAKQECVDIANETVIVAAGGGQEEFEAEKAAFEQQLREKEEELAMQEQEAMDLMRKMDEFPTRSELLQMELRITELNEEIVWKYEEVKSVFLLYNTRAEVAKVRANEEEIFQQIGSLVTYCLSQPAKKTAQERQQLLKESKNITEQIQASAAAQDRKKREEMVLLQEGKKKYDSLKESQYEFQELMEELNASLEEHQALMVQLEELNPVDLNAAESS